MESLRGALLIAAPSLVDPNFHRTVALVVQHDDEGAMGLVLNRPSPTAVAEAVPDLGDAVEHGAPVFLGGPVQPEAVVVMAEFSDPEAAASMVVGDVGLVSSSVETGELAERIRRARVFAGYAGWGPGQLEAEMDEESWIVEPPLPDELFSERPDELWSDVLARKGGEYALLALMPPDPSLN